ncbi:MAG: hypothetical protein K2N06_04610 [Oscillospiraceae bacterium]|nr:hypothetical protein [Oscillospiraceae bacterium]
MKRAKIIRIVFVTLNVFNVLAACGLMILQSFMKQPMNWEPPFFLALIYCVPAALVINIVWLFAVKHVASAEFEER